MERGDTKVLDLLCEDIHLGYFACGLYTEGVSNNDGIIALELVIAFSTGRRRNQLQKSVAEDMIDTALLKMTVGALNIIK